MDMAMERPKLSTVLICIGLFLIFLLFSFPFQNLKGFIFGRVYKETGITLVADNIYLSVFGWPGLGLTNLELTTNIMGKEFDLSCKKAVFRIGIGGLFPPAPSISISLKGLKKGGDLFIKFTQTKARVKASIEADELALEQVNVAGLPEPITGILNVDGSINLDNVDTSKSTGGLDLDITKLKIPPQNMMGFMLPITNIGTAKAKINIKNGVGEIGSFQIGTRESDLQGSATGDIRLGKTFLSSFLNLVLRIQMSERYAQNPQSASLVSLLTPFKSAAGDFAMKWSSTIQEMTTNVMSALPQKVPD
jgi:type II secretion system protein N